MAVLFDDATPDFAEVDTALATAAPLTMACWVYSDSAANNYCMMGLFDLSVTNRFFALRRRTTGPLNFQVRSATNVTVETVTSMSLNTWHHAIGISASATDHRVYLDAGGAGSSGVNSVPSGIDRTSIGHLGDLSPSQAWSGRVAEAAIWIAALDAGERAALAAGVSPLLVRPASLVFYLPLLNTTWGDRVGGLILTPSGSPVAAAHPRMYYPSGRRIASAPSGAPPATAALTGTVTDDSEVEIVAGGSTIILTLTGDTWIAAGAPFNAQRQAIIDGLTSAGAEATGWNNEVRDNEVVGAVVRTSATVVTITLSAAPAYDITANETVTATIPGAALTGGAPIVAVPTFTILVAGAPSVLTGLTVTVVEDVD